MDALHRLGAKSVPVVAIGEKFVFAQSLADVAGLLGLQHDATPQLSPDALVQRLDGVLAAAARLVRQLPADVLETDVRNRARSHRELGYHIFRLVEAFIDVAVATNPSLERTHLNQPAPDGMRSTDEIAAYGEEVRRLLAAWWRDEPDRGATRTIATYYGPQPLHHVLERITWHPAQHVRQIAMLLEDMDIPPDRPLGEAELAGLPLPEKVWDD
jgi:hypothetical protein